MKDAQKPDHVSLTTLIDRLRDGRYVIPDFQREFEWEPWDIRELMRSIFLDYYIGSLLLWKGTSESFDALACEPIYGFKGRVDASHIVLDDDAGKLPPHVRQKIDERIQAASKKTPALDANRYETLAGKWNTLIYVIFKIRLRIGHLHHCFSHTFRIRKCSSNDSTNSLSFVMASDIAAR